MQINCVLVALVTVHGTFPNRTILLLLLVWSKPVPVNLIACWTDVSIFVTVGVEDASHWKSQIHELEHKDGTELTLTVNLI